MAMIQIRDLPDDVHRALRIKAAAAGLSLSAYLRRELEALADRRSAEEVLAEWAGDLPEVPAQAVIDAIQDGRR